MQTVLKFTGEDQFIYEVSGTVGVATGEFALYTNRLAECPLDVHVQLTACEGVEFSLRSDSTEPPCETTESRYAYEWVDAPRR